MGDDGQLFFEDRSARLDVKVPQDDGKSQLERDLEQEVFGRGTAFDEEELGEEGVHADEGVSLKPVWEDEDDADVAVDVTKSMRLRKLRKTPQENVLGGKEYGSRLREFHRKVVGVKGEWAALPVQKRRRKKKIEDGENSDVDSEDSSDALDKFKRSTQVVSDQQAGGGLKPGTINIRRVRDANCEDYCRSVVTSIQFHPTSPLMVCAGLDKTIRIFQIDGKDNPKQLGIYLKDMPIHSAKFINDGKDILAVGERKYFYQYDIPTGTVQKIQTLCREEEKTFRKFVSSVNGEQLGFLGDNGKIHLLSARSKQKIGFLKMNAQVRDGAFTADGTQMLTIGGDGLVYRWDLRTRRCVERHVDDGCLRGNAISVSRQSGFYACGADSGVVNVYNRSSKKPKKSFLNLTTAIDGIEFSPQGDMMAFFSHSLKNSFRIAHTSTMTVFSNWPTPSLNLRRIYCTAFSPGGGYLAAGNDKGIVCLFRLLHNPAL